MSLLSGRVLVRGCERWSELVGVPPSSSLIVSQSITNAVVFPQSTVPIWVPGTSSYYNLLLRIFREVGCSRIASFWWNQGTGVDPTQPLTLLLTPARTQNGLTRLWRSALLWHRTRNSPSNLNADHDSEVRTMPICFSNMFTMSYINIVLNIIPTLMRVI